MFDQSSGIIANRPIGIIDKAIDLRSQLLVDGNYRDYYSPAEALETLTGSDPTHTAAIRSGHFPVYVTPAESTICTVYWFLGGTSDADLKQIPSAAVDSHSILPFAFTVTLDFTSLNNLRTLTLTGNVTFVTTSKGAARSRVYRIITDDTLRTMSWPLGWVWVGTVAPVDQAPSKTAILSLTCFGTAETDVVAGYAVQL